MGLHQRFISAGQRMGTAHVAMRSHPLRAIFSVILLVRQLLLRDIACNEEYADGDALTMYMLRREIADPSDYDPLQVTSALRYSDRFGLCTVL